MPGGRDARIELDDRLDDLAPRRTQIVALEIDAPDARRLSPRHVNHKAACDDDRRHYRYSARSHVTLPFSLPFFRVSCAITVAIPPRRRLSCHWTMMSIRPNSLPTPSSFATTAVKGWCRSMFRTRPPCPRRCDERQPNVNANTSTPASRNSISNVRSAIGPGCLTS